MILFLHVQSFLLTYLFSYLQVPLGPLAFMPGKIVHTNEILVLLGDNWFVERSAKQATEIIGRRIKSTHGQSTLHCVFVHVYALHVHIQSINVFSVLLIII